MSLQLKPLLILSFFSVSSLVGRANQFKTKQFYENIRIQKDNADAWANALVRDDLLEITREVIQQVGVANHEFGLVQEHEETLKKLMTSFLNGSSEASTAAEIQKIQEQFFALQKALYSYSWKLTQSDAHFANIGTVIKNLESRMAYQCTTGRSNANFDADIPHTPPPPVPYHWALMVNLSTQGTSANGSAGFASSSGFADKGARTRSEIVKWSSTAAGVGASLYLGVKAGLIVEHAAFYKVAGAALGGVGLAVAAVAMAVDAIIHARKALKRQREFDSADAYLFKKTKRGSYIAEQYRVLCAERSQLVSETLKSLQSIISGSEVDVSAARDELARESNWIKKFETAEQKASENTPVPLMQSAYKSPHTQLEHNRYNTLMLKQYFTETYPELRTALRETFPKNMTEGMSQSFAIILKLAKDYRQKTFSSEVTEGEKSGSDQDYLSLALAYENLIQSYVRHSLGQVGRDEFLKKRRGFRAKLQSFLTKYPDSSEGAHLQKSSLQLGVSL